MALHPANILLEKCHASLLQDDGREYMMGVDEAGRGPTLGPMVYGSAFCAVDDEHRLRKMGFNDSKQLTEAKREQLWNDMQTLDFIGWKIRSLEATEISEGMLRRHQKCATLRGYHVTQDMWLAPKVTIRTCTPHMCTLPISTHSKTSLNACRRHNSCAEESHLPNAPQAHHLYARKSTTYVQPCPSRRLPNASCNWHSRQEP